MRLSPAFAGIALCLALFGAAAPGAQMPRVTAFNDHDSLAVAIDCAELLSEERCKRLREGYPLSFIVELSLVRHDPLWFDARLLSREARFRITHEKWTDRYRFALSDFSGTTTEVSLERLGDVLLELEDRLSTTLAALAGLDVKARYYCSVDVEYRNLTLEDVKSAEQWLRGGVERDSTAERDGRSPGDGALGFLWDLAGLKGERRTVVTPKFRLSQLRRAE